MDQSVSVTKTEEQKDEKSEERKEEQFPTVFDEQSEEQEDEQEDEPFEPNTPEPEPEENNDDEEMFDDEMFNNNVMQAYEMFGCLQKLEEYSRMKCELKEFVFKLEGQANCHRNMMFNALRLGYGIPQTEAGNFKVREDKLDMWSQRLHVVKKDKARLTAQLEQHLKKITPYLTMTRHDAFWLRWQELYEFLPEGVTIFSDTEPINAMVWINSTLQAAREAKVIEGYDTSESSTSSSDDD